MRKRIFASILLPALGVVAAVSAFLMVALHSYYSEDHLGNLKDETYVIARAIDLSGEDFLDGLETSLRITVISPQGDVLFDNTSDVSQMDNHLDREEVLEALSGETGVSQRYSSTIAKKTVYVAVLLENGNVLRLSDTQRTIPSLLLGHLWQLVIIFAAGTVLALILARRLSLSITQPINNIDLECPDETKVYRELHPLVLRIQEQNRQILSSMEDLKRQHEKQDTMRRDFTANVSHELKTPLTSISGYAELIRTGIAKPEDISRFAGKIHDESQRLITLVGDIIKLSQLDSREITLSMEDIDLYETCASAIYHLEPLAGEKQVTVTLSGDHAKIRGASLIVDEMVYNLCDNAIKYNVPGGRVDVSVRTCADGVELSVCDTGIGIPEEDKPHVFERFYRVDKSHSKAIGGTGLGLSIVKHAAKFHNARISMDSQSEKGTSIRILF